MIHTTTINKWWDSLSSEKKEEYFNRMNPFNFGKPKFSYMLNKNQKYDLYSQVHKLFGSNLNPIKL